MTELVGVLAALVILLLVFRSPCAAALPIVTGLAGVASSTVSMMLLSNLVTLPTTTTTLGMLNGMAVGAAAAVMLAVLSAITLLPALLNMLGNRVLSRRQRAQPASDGPAPGGARAGVAVEGPPQAPAPLRHAALEPGRAVAQKGG